MHRDPQPSLLGSYLRCKELEVDGYRYLPVIYVEHILSLYCLTRGMSNLDLQINAILILLVSYTVEPLPVTRHPKNVREYCIGNKKKKLFTYCI